MSEPNTFARCHVVLYKGYDEPRPEKGRRKTKMRLFRDLKDAVLFFKEQQEKGNAIELHIEPPMVGGEFTSVVFGEDDL